jgi:hypothetical protein
VRRRLRATGILTRELLIKYTPDWTGERFPDGRPKVPDGIVERMKNVTLEEAWAELRAAGFNHQYEDGWLAIHPGKVLVGPRADGAVAARPSRHPQSD